MFTMHWFVDAMAILGGLVTLVGGVRGLLGAREKRLEKLTQQLKDLVKRTLLRDDIDKKEAFRIRCNGVQGDTFFRAVRDGYHEGVPSRTPSEATAFAEFIVREMDSRFANRGRWARWKRKRMARKAMKELAGITLKD